jgi:hypothetical protein
VHDFYAYHAVEQLTGEVASGSASGGGVIELSGSGLGQGNQLFDGINGNRRMYNQNIRCESE